MLSTGLAGRTCKGQGNDCVFRIATQNTEANTDMTWTTPIITEVCIGMEVTSYMSAEI